MSGLGSYLIATMTNLQTSLDTIKHVYVYTVATTLGSVLSMVIHFQVPV